VASRRETVHSRYLFPAIVFVLVGQPVVASLSAASSGILAIPLSATLVAAIWSLDERGLWVRLAVTLGFFVVAVVVMNALLPHPLWTLGSAIGVLALAAISTALGIRWLFGAPRVTVESLLAAMSVYLLIGIGFGLLNVVLYTRDPSWYQGVSPAGASAEVADLVYYSLGTLTGTAFGDVLPTHPIPRLLANVEAIVGQMYVAVLVAMLVSGYAADRAAPSDRKPNR